MDTAVSCRSCQGSGRIGPRRWAVRFACHVGPAVVFFGALLAGWVGGGRMLLSGEAQWLAIGIAALAGAWLFGLLFDVGIVFTIIALVEAVQILRGKGFPSCPDCGGLGRS